MSLLEPRRNKTEIQKPAPVHPTATFVDTNALLKKAIQNLPASIRSEIVLRCDELAPLQISEEAIEKAFSQLLQMIIDEREAESKLFLHITCASDKKQQAETTSPCLSRFLIQFHTNLKPHSAWMQEAGNQINRIASLLTPFDGSLLVNQLKNSGCVFVISLPGK